LWNDYEKGNNKKIKTEEVIKFPFNAASVASVRKTERAACSHSCLFCSETLFAIWNKFRNLCPAKRGTIGCEQRSGKCNVCFGTSRNEKSPTKSGFNLIDLLNFNQFNQ
jgi:hypothetical protein